MPSPFPGMDPFLEDPDIFPDFHDSFITHVRERIQERLPPPYIAAEYHVSIHRFDNLEDFFVYPIRLNQPLPEITIPLLPGDPPLPLDLQAVFQRTYNAGPYHREIDYRQDAPAPPLGQVWRSWLRQVLAQEMD